jgi:hypothetical protein
MTSPDSPETPRDATIAGMTITGSTVAAICSETGVSPSTVHRVRRDYRTYIDTARQELVEAVGADLVTLCDTATAALRQLLTSNNEAIKLGAARTVLDQASRWHGDLDVERRLQALEEQQRGGGQYGQPW